MSRKGKGRKCPNGESRGGGARARVIGDCTLYGPRSNVMLQGKEGSNDGGNELEKRTELEFRFWVFQVVLPVHEGQQMSRF